MAARTVLALFDVADLPVLTWAARLAMAAGRPLDVLCVDTDGDGSRSRRRIAAESVDDATPDLVRRALEAASALELPEVHVHECRGRVAHRVVLDAAGELGAADLVLPAPVGSMDEARRAVVRRVARAAPDDVLVLDAGSLGVVPPARIVVPQVGGGGAHALRLATRGLGDGSAPVVAVPDPKHASRSRRVFERVRGRKPGARAARLSQVDVPDGSLTEAVPAMLEAGDFVMLDAEDAKRVPKLVRSLETWRDERPDTPFAVGLARAADATGPGRFERLVERLRIFAPALPRDERKALHEQLEAGGRLSTDFVVMLTLSAAIAALGLVQDSAAVVIGAMLVAPLMTPLVAAGLSLVQGNLMLFRGALRAMAIGITGAVAVSFVIGLAVPWDDLTGEILARGGPNPFDLLIAALSGMAGAYALARPGVAGTLVGVSIAVALVPPLSAVGIAVAAGEGSVAIGAATLFATNFLAIILGAAAVFRFFGLQVSRQGDDAPRWVRGVLASLVIGVVAVTGSLVHNLATQMSRGVNRALQRPLPSDVRAAVRERVASEGGVRLLSMGESTLDDARGVDVVLVADGAVPSGLSAALQDLVTDGMGAGTPVRVLVLRAAD